MTRARYPTDLTEHLWRRVEPHLPPPKPRRPAALGGPPRGRQRDPLRAAQRHYLARPAARLSALAAVYHYFRLWRLDGTWERLHDALRDQVRGQDGREASPSAAIIDGQSVKTTEGGPRGFDAAKLVSGRKRHLLVATLGLLLVVVVHAASIQESEGAKLVLRQAVGRFPRLRLIWAVEIVERPAGAKGFRLLPRRWVVERTFAWLGRSRRLSKDYEGLPATSEVWVRIAMIRLMLKRLAPH